jgi:SAM-dependent MidA family methyltransferase
MTALKGELKRQIAADGPMGIDRFMTLCLTHPRHGYYMGRDPFGRGGDFITAPEVSQIFGELVGIWCAAAWQIMDMPGVINLVELGPGRGTLMADLVRAAKVMPGLADALSIHLVEVSPALKTVQEKTLTAAGIKARWHDAFEDVPTGPLVVVANEFFDALPLRQFVRTGTHFRERVVGLDGAGELVFGLGSDEVSPGAMPQWAQQAPEGAIVEVSPAREAVAEAIGARLAGEKGAALIIDYGHMASGSGDTLQAVRKHRSVDVLAFPGEADLTSHVDFAALGHALERGGVKVHGPVTQGEFLMGMGLREREEALKRRADQRQRIIISRAAQRLAAGVGMGQLFKVIAASHADLPDPHPFQREPQ